MKIFISHAKEDAALAGQWKDLLTDLAAGFIDVWYSSDLSPGGGMPGGVEWRSSLIKHLKESRAVIAIVTRQSMFRPWIYWECGVAAGTDQERLIFPVCYDVAISKVPGPLNGYQVFNGQDGNDVRRICQQLLAIGKGDARISDKVFNTLISDYLRNVAQILAGSAQKSTLAVEHIYSFDLHKGYVNDIVWVSDDCRKFASASDDATIKVVSLDSKAKPISIVDSNQIKSICFAQGFNALLYGVLPGLVKYVKLPNHHGTPSPLFDHPGIRSIDFGESNHCIATGGYNNELRIHKIVDLSKGMAEQVLVMSCRGSTRTVAWNSDNSVIAYSEGSLINLLQFGSAGPEENIMLSGHSNSVVSMSWSKDDLYLASGDADGNIIIWDSVSGKIKYQCNRHSTIGPIRTVSFHPQSPNLIAAGGTVGVIEIIRFTDDEYAVRTITIGNPPMFVNRILWTTNGDALLLACSDTVQVVFLKG